MIIQFVMQQFRDSLILNEPAINAPSALMLPVKLFQFRLDFVGQRRLLHTSDSTFKSHKPIDAGGIVDREDPQPGLLRTDGF